MIVTTSAEYLRGKYLRRAAEAEALARQMSRNDHRDEALQEAAECRRRAAALEERARSFHARE
jgi:hypothetical protein